MLHLRSFSAGFIAIIVIVIIIPNAEGGWETLYA